MGVPGSPVLPLLRANRPMARRVTKPTPKTKKAAPAKKAARDSSPKKSAVKKGSATKTTSKEAAKGPKAAPPKKAVKKKGAPKAPQKKASKPQTPATKVPATKAKKVVASKPPAKAAAPAKPTSKPSTRKAKVAPPPKPVPRPKPSAAELEALRIAKERREAQDRQSEYYDKAIKAFHGRKFQRALGWFEKVEAGPDITLRDRARVHVEICRRQTETRKVKLKTADELYNYGIQLINERRFQEAGQNIAQALKVQPRAAHIHFAAAVVAALTRDTEAAYKSLKKAIELDPRNRVLALNDSDLASVTGDPAIAQLLHGDS